MYLCHCKTKCYEKDYKNTGIGPTKLLNIISYDNLSIVEPKLTPLNHVAAASPLKPVAVYCAIIGIRTLVPSASRRKYLLRTSTRHKINRELNL